MINPCGLPIEMVSLVDLPSDDVVSEEVASEEGTMQYVTERLLEHMKSIFGWDIAAQDPNEYWRKLDG